MPRCSRKATGHWSWGKSSGSRPPVRVIWTWGWQLLDGSWFRLPRIAVHSLAGENLEGAARPVDFEVDRPLGEWEQGRDRQLDEAIRRLLEQIDGNGERNQEPGTRNES